MTYICIPIYRDEHWTCSNTQTMFKHLKHVLWFAQPEYVLSFSNTQVDALATDSRNESSLRAHPPVCKEHVRGARSNEHVRADRKQISQFSLSLSLYIYIYSLYIYIYISFVFGGMVYIYIYLFIYIQAYI